MSSEFRKAPRLFPERQTVSNFVNTTDNWVIHHLVSGFGTPFFCSLRRSAINSPSRPGQCPGRRGRPRTFQDPAEQPSRSPGPLGRDKRDESADVASVQETNKRSC